MKKLIITLIIIVFCITAVLIYFNIDKPKEYKCLVLGDSISAGYGLDDINDSYASVMVEDIKENGLKEKDSIEMENKAISGLNSTDLLQKIDSGEIEINKDTDIITMSIGANDVLKPVENILSDIMPNIINGNDDNSTLKNIFNDISEVKDLIAELVSDDGLKNNPEIIKSAEAFKGNFDEIISKIKEKAPNCKIYVMNVYNPYKDWKFPYMDISQMTKDYIDIINNSFDKNSDEYTLIDVYDDFNNKEASLINANLLKFNIDPHPNKEGHKEISDLFSKEIEKDLNNEQ